MSKSVKQKRCPRDDELGQLVSVRITRDYPFNNPTGIRFRWVCQKCHDTFETEIPYLEILKVK